MIKNKFIFIFLGTVFLGLAFLIPEKSSANVLFTNPLGVGSVEGFLAKIMTNIQGFLVTIAIIMILVGGIMYMLSFGNEQAMEKAKKVVAASAIGLAIALSARTFLQTIWDIVGGASGAAPPGGDSFQVITGRVLTFLLSIVGIVAIISLIIGGIMYLTSYGDEDRISKGKKIVLASVIGIVISVGSVVLVKQVGKLLGYNF